MPEQISQRGFDVGYLQGSNGISMRSKEDLVDVWASIRKGTKVILWCDGLKVNLGKRQKTGDSSEDEEIEDTRKKMKADYSDETRKNADKDKKVQATIDSLKTKHGVAFTPMQYRLWAEMYHGGVHPGLDIPPTTTMFVRAGGGTTKKTGHTSNIGEVVSQAITQLTSALSPKTTLPSAGSTAGSPAKVIEN